MEKVHCPNLRPAQNFPGNAYVKGKGCSGDNGEYVVTGQMRERYRLRSIRRRFVRILELCATIVPRTTPSIFCAIWCFCSSPEYNTVRQCGRIDQKLNVTNATLAKVPFDLDHWTKVAEERYPNGLPRPYSDDPNQWLFHGHPCGSVIWDETAKWTAHGPLRTDPSVLHVTVARLLGYRWPAEQDAEMELADERAGVGAVLRGRWLVGRTRTASYASPRYAASRPPANGYWNCWP